VRRVGCVEDRRRVLPELDFDSSTCSTTWVTDEKDFLLVRMLGLPSVGKIGFGPNGSSGADRFSFRWRGSSVNLVFPSLSMPMNATRTQLSGFGVICIASNLIRT